MGGMGKDKVYNLPILFNLLLENSFPVQAKKSLDSIVFLYIVELDTYF